MNIRYFFIKDRVQSKEIRVEYCPTGDVVAGFFMKPLQGRQFYKLRDKVMNFDLNSKYQSNHRSVLSENSEVTEDTDENKATGKVATASNVGNGDGQFGFKG